MKAESKISYKDVVIIIPAYNEGKSIKRVIEAIPKTFENIIAVDDGSIDDTAHQIEKSRAELVSHPLNLGQGAALQTGIEYALHDNRIRYFVTFDADGQHQISDVKRMIEVIRKNDVDIILGSRFLGQAKNITKVKRFILKLAVGFSNVSTGLALSDTHNGLRVFNRKVAEGLNLKMADFSHASEILERIAEKKYSYKEVPVTITYTDYSRNKGQSMINAINIVFDVLLARIVKK